MVLSNDGPGRARRHRGAWRSLVGSGGGGGGGLVSEQISSTLKDK